MPILANADGTDKFSEDMGVLGGGLNVSQCLVFKPSTNSIISDTCPDGKGICKSNLGLT